MIGGKRLRHRCIVCLDKPIRANDMASSFASLVQSFGVAPAITIGFLGAVVIVGLLETLRQELKLKRTEREWRRWRRVSEQFGQCA